MANRTLDKRLRRLEETTEVFEDETVFIYDPKAGVPENVKPSYVVFLPDNGRDVIE
ncbi:hypothetical protein [Methanolobus sp. WCC5]|jgi:hypothetical protein|uniref:hypothetical protein n=1 Tax=Methanolobus sp. WCC5 TaxID=3125785 RepID=UPI003246C832